jgi:hypothetical protein
MKEFIHIQDYLVSPETLEPWHQDNPELAADNLNQIFHMIYDRADENMESELLNELIEKAYVLLSQSDDLTELESEEIFEWVEQFLANEL